jgi:hypothetical protein
MRTHISMDAAVLAAFLFCITVGAPLNAVAGAGDCGQPVSTGQTPTASDALSILSTAVGSSSCETCVCDADGSGAITATDSLLILNIAVGLGSGLFCEPCVAPRVDLEGGGVASWTAVALSAAAGGTVELDGALLEVPPGALSEDAELGLSALPVDSFAIPAGDGARGGQIPLSTNAFLITADRDVTLFDALTLTLPFDPGAIPAGVAPEHLRVAAAANGYLVPQGMPMIADTVGGSISFEIDAPEILKGAETQSSSAPVLGAGVPFPDIVTESLRELPDPPGPAGLVPSLHWQTYLATVDDLDGLVEKSEPWLSTRTAHFDIRFREGTVDFGAASRIGVALEDAWTVLVDGDGFSLPNEFDLDGLYTVFVDDFDDHAAVGEWEDSGVVDGFTLPGSGLVEGASYVNVDASEDEWPSIAVHEFFHALQYGALSDAGASANFIEAFDAGSGWLWEGATAALSGRLIFGAGSPRRNDFVSEEMPQRRSIWSLVEEDPPDTAQEFFVYLEKSVGDTSFYRPIFESLAADIDLPATPTARFVTAVEKGLADAESDETLEEAWSGFVFDRAIGSPNLYNATFGLLKAEEIVGLTADGAVVSRLKQIPPLSYYLFKYLVPGVEPQNEQTDLRRDVELRFKAFGTDVDKLPIWLHSIPAVAGFPQQVSIDEDGEEVVVRIEDYRNAFPKQLFLVVGNAGTEEGLEVALEFIGSLVE